jgi:hypothetical protein
LIDPVTVYQWLCLDDPDGSPAKPSTQYATADMIRNGLGRSIPGSAMEVERADLRYGLYVPRKSKPHFT